MSCTDLWERSSESVFPSSSLWGFYFSSLSCAQLAIIIIVILSVLQHSLLQSTHKHWTRFSLVSYRYKLWVKSWLCYGEWQISRLLQWGCDFTHSLSKNLGKANLLKEVNVIAGRRRNLSFFQGNTYILKMEARHIPTVGERQREESRTYSSPSVLLFSLSFLLS